MSTLAAGRGDVDRRATLASIPFFLVHVVAVAGVFVFGFSWQGLLLAVALYYLRMFAGDGRLPPLCRMCAAWW